MGSRNTSVRTPRQKVSQPTDNTRPPGLTALAPVRLFRDFSTKTQASFRTIPTSAAVVRTRNHNGTNQLAQLGWHQILGIEEYGHGNYGSPVYDLGSGEFSSTQYTNAGTVGGSFASADARLLSDVTVATDSGMLVLDTKMSRDGRYTYVLSAANPSSVAAVYFNVYDNLSGLQLSPTLASTSNPTGILTPGRTRHQPLVSAWGNIAVVDDTTTQDATHHMAYNSCMFTVQFLTNSGGGNFAGSHAVYRFDYVANNVDEMYSGGQVDDFTTTSGTANAWAEIQLVTQTGGTLQAMLGYRSSVTITATDRGTPHFEMWTTFVAGDSPSSGPQSIAGGIDADFVSTPTTAVSRRGAPAATRRFYYYYNPFSSPGLAWNVLNPATFFSIGTPDQSVASSFPAGTAYVAAKASALPPAFVDGSSNPHMFVAFVYKNTTANVTNVQCFMHTTVTAGSDTAPSLGNTPPGITVVTASGSQPTSAVGVSIASDPGGVAARAVMVYLNPNSSTYTLTEATCTDPTDMTKIFPQTVVSTAGSTNTVLDTLPGSNRGGFAYGATYWDFSSAQDKNDVQALAFLKSTGGQVLLRVATPYAAVALLWDADVYENLPNPTDANTNPRTTTFYARGTGADDAGYFAGVILYTYSTGGYTGTTGSNTTDLTGSFASNTATTPSVATAASETTPAFTHPSVGELTSFTATMIDEFTFAISSWAGAPVILASEIQVGMTIGIQSPFTASLTYVRYTIASVTYNSTSQTITQITVSQPAPFHAASANYGVTISVGPATAVRQLITTKSDGEINNRTGNVVFPMVVQVDYVSIETVATHSEIAEMVVPLEANLPPSVPTGVQIQLRGYNLNNSTIPTNQAAGIEVGVSLDAGSTWRTKVLSINSTSIHGHTSATAFGAQAFVGSSDGDVPWTTVPAGIDIGDYLTIAAGSPNAGRYVITGVTNDTTVGPRVYVDRPFPVPGNATVVEWYVTTAKDDYESAGTTPDLGFGSFGMNFDLAGLTSTVSSTGIMHVRIEFKDGTTGAGVTYEIDSISVQWSP